MYVNNNGYVAFDEEVTTLFSATKLDQRLLAIFFADVDTRADAGGGTVHYGPDTVDGRAAFGATWPGVGYYERHYDKLDAFQVILIDRADTGAGHFDVEFNFGTIAWESGDRSDGSVDGVGGWPSAIVGYSDGVNSTLFPGSGVPGSFLDGNLATGLIHGQSQGSVLGRYIFAFPQDPVAGGAALSDAALTDAGAAEGALDAAAPSDPNPSRALGCTCEVSAVQASTGCSKLGWLTCGAVAVLWRRRRLSRVAARGWLAQ